MGKREGERERQVVNERKKDRKRVGLGEKERGGLKN